MVAFSAPSSFLRDSCCVNRSTFPSLKQGAIALLSSLSIVVVVGEGAIAQMTPDNSTNTQLNPTESGFDIDVGDQRGRNLFHSFSDFNVDDGQFVRFLHENNIENIINRVTGDSLSEINGTLNVEGDANLFLLNPNGIIFGENAQLDLRGSFIASTADEIKFGNRGTFSATNTDEPAANLRITPDALVFNQLANRPDINNRTILVQRPNADNPEGLSVASARSLFLAGGPVSFEGGVLQAPQGRIEIAALGDEAELAIENNANDNRNANRFWINREEFPLDVTRADVALSRRALLDVTGQNRGDITIYGRSIRLSNLSNICGGIGLSTACIQDSENTEFFAETSGSETSAAGNIILNVAEDVSLARGSQIVNAVYTNATAQDEANSRDAVDDLLAVFASQGLVDFDQLFGSIVIVADDINVGEEESGSNIAAQLNTSTFGVGNAGLIFLIARDSVNIRGLGRADDGIRPQLLSSVRTGADGDAGGVVISTNSLTLSEFAGITVSTSGEGSPGNVDIFADDPSTSVENDGIVDLLDGSVIFANVEAGGNGGVIISEEVANSIEDPSQVRTSDEGAIDIRAGSVTLLDGAQLQTLVRGRTEQSNEVGRGDAGNIIVSTGTLLIAGTQTSGDSLPSSLFSSVGRGATGDGGAIIVRAGNVILQDEGFISATTAGAGGLDNNNVETDISTGGTIFVLSGNLLVNEESRISASAARDNAAGNILIATNGLQVFRDGSFLDATTGSGNGGNIFTFGNGLFLAEESNIRTRAGDRGGADSNGGNIGLGFNIILGYPSNDSNIDARAPEGRGGVINIPFTNLQGIGERSDDFRITNDITASGGIQNGSVTISEFDVDPVRGLFELPAVVVDVESLLVSSCPGPGQRDTDELGALYVTGQGGIPPSISDRPSTDDIVADWVAYSGPDNGNDVAAAENQLQTSSANILPPSEPQAVEAQELVQDANGDLWLVASENAPTVTPPSPQVCTSATTIHSSS